MRVQSLVSVPSGFAVLSTSPSPGSNRSAIPVNDPSNSSQVSLRGPVAGSLM
jgi:hypothetical protein